MRQYLLCSVILLCACSGGESGSEGHVWQEQTGKIDSAGSSEDELGSASAAQRQRIEEQSQ